MSVRYGRVAHLRQLSTPRYRDVGALGYRWVNLPPDRDFPPAGQSTSQARERELSPTRSALSDPELKKKWANLKTTSTWLNPRGIYHYSIAGVARDSLTPSFVKLSVKSDYAMRAVLALARRFPTGAPERVETLAAEQGIPPNYLVQILIELKSQRLVRSLRGKEGGYVLARPPAEISMGDVLRSIHGQIFDSPAMEDNRCPPELRAAWQRLQDAVNAAADSLNFQALLEEGADRSRMYFI